MSTYEKAKKVKEKYEDILMQKRNVVGIGIGREEKKAGLSEKYCIKVYISEKIPQNKRKQENEIPDEIEGIKTIIIEVGRIKFLNEKAKKDE